jgi:hypothetical protein
MRPDGKSLRLQPSFYIWANLNVSSDCTNAPKVSERQTTRLASGLPSGAKASSLARRGTAEAVPFQGQSTKLLKPYVVTAKLSSASSRSIVSFTLPSANSDATRTAFLMAFVFDDPCVMMHTPFIPSSGAPP